MKNKMLFKKIILFLFINFLFIFNIPVLSQTKSGLKNLNVANKLTTPTIPDWYGTDWYNENTKILSFLQHNFSYPSVSASLRVYASRLIHREGSSAFYGGVLMSNGKACSIPFNSTKVGIYDPICKEIPIVDLLGHWFNKL